MAKRADMDDSSLTIPFDFFMKSPQESLQTFALERLEMAARMEREAKSIRREAQQLREAAGVALWLANHREELLRSAASTVRGLGTKAKEALQAAEETESEGENATNAAGGE